MRKKNTAAAAPRRKNGRSVENVPAGTPVYAVARIARVGSTELRWRWVVWNDAAHVQALPDSTVTPQPADAGGLARTEREAMIQAAAAAPTCPVKIPRRFATPWYLGRFARLDAAEGEAARAHAWKTAKFRGAMSGFLDAMSVASDHALEIVAMRHGEQASPEIDESDRPVVDLAGAILLLGIDLEALDDDATGRLTAQFLSDAARAVRELRRDFYAVSAPPPSNVVDLRSWKAARHGG